MSSLMAPTLGRLVVRRRRWHPAHPLEPQRRARRPPGEHTTVTSESDHLLADVGDAPRPGRGRRRRRGRSPPTTAPVRDPAIASAAVRAATIGSIGFVPGAPLRAGRACRGPTAASAIASTSHHERGGPGHGEGAVRRRRRRGGSRPSRPRPATAATTSRARAGRGHRRTDVRRTSSRRRTESVAVALERGTGEVGRPGVRPEGSRRGRPRPTARARTRARPRAGAGSVSAGSSQ